MSVPTANPIATPGPSDVPAEVDPQTSAPFVMPAWLDVRSRLHLMPAWGLSLLLHAAIAAMLMSISYVIVNDVEFRITSELPAEEAVEREFIVDTEITQVVGNSSHLDLVGPSLAAAQNSGMKVSHASIPELEPPVDAQLPLMAALPLPDEANLLQEIDLMGTTEYPGGTEGAIDRITWEIAASLRERKTIVVWLFDESLSLEKRRLQIADRFAAIYAQLGQMNVNADENLTTGLVGFGKDVHLLQGTLSNNTAELTRRVRTIANDESGQELAFAAVERALRKFGPEKKEQRANLMLVIVTDERGDDYAKLEPIIKQCARTGTRVYCVGNTSILGREKGYVRYAWEADGDRFEEDIPVDQGPESVMVEGLQLPFWSPALLNQDRISSGFGPYALSRLCAESGGIFFVADDAVGATFDEAIMRQYAPDYRPIKDYLRQLETNRAKANLVKAAQYGIPDDAIPQPVRRFAATSDSVLKQQITLAQRPFAALDYYLEELHQILEQGEAHRDKLDSDRWRAGFDLALGRVLAMRVRAFGYNMLLADMKTNPRKFEREGSNMWTLRASQTVDAGAKVKIMHDKATEYLNRVIKDHPSTPWARLAAVELKEPFGWSWHEGVMPVPRQGQPNTNGPRFAPEDREQMRRNQARNRKREATRPKL